MTQSEFLTEVRSNEDHGRGDLRPVGLPALVPVRRGHVLHHAVQGQLVIALDVRTAVRTELAAPLMLKRREQDMTDCEANASCMMYQHFDQISKKRTF